MTLSNGGIHVPESGQRVKTLHAVIMFGTTLVYLAVLAVVVQWWNSTQAIEQDTRLTLQLLVIIWLPFVVESLVGLARNPELPNNRRNALLICLLPPFRLGYSTFHDSRIIWLPKLGWRYKDRDLYEHLYRLTAIPMIVIALMILPWLGIDFMLKERAETFPWLNQPWISLVLDVSAAFIWFAFALEYVVMLSLAEEKIPYIKKHWLNLVIILLPLLAFMRGFQLVRVFRVTRAGKLLRVYRMRGLMIRVYQAMVALSAIERLIHRNPEKHLSRLEKLHDEKLRELNELQEKMETVRAQAETFRASRAAESRADS
jgi:hypothetical protein